MRLSIAYLALICLRAQATTAEDVMDSTLQEVQGAPLAEAPAVPAVEEVNTADEGTPLRTWLRTNKREPGQFNVQSAISTLTDKLDEKKATMSAKRAALKEKMGAQFVEHMNSVTAQIDEAELTQLISNLLQEENLALINEISSELAKVSGDPEALVLALLAQKDNIMKLFAAVMGDAMPTLPAAGPGEEELEAVTVELKEAYLHRKLQEEIKPKAAADGAVEAQADAPSQGDVQDALILSAILTLINLPKLGLKMGFVTFVATFLAFLNRIGTDDYVNPGDIWDVVDGGTEDD